MKQEELRNVNGCSMDYQFEVDDETGKVQAERNFYDWLSNKCVKGKLTEFVGDFSRADAHLMVNLLTNIVRYPENNAEDSITPVIDEKDYTVVVLTRYYHPEQISTILNFWGNILSEEQINDVLNQLMISHDAIVHNMNLVFKIDRHANISDISNIISTLSNCGGNTGLVLIDSLDNIVKNEMAVIPVHPYCVPEQLNPGDKNISKEDKNDRLLTIALDRLNDIVKTCNIPVSGLVDITKSESCDDDGDLYSIFENISLADMGTSFKMLEHADFAIKTTIWSSSKFTENATPNSSSNLSIRFRLVKSRIKLVQK